MNGGGEVLPIRIRRTVVVVLPLDLVPLGVGQGTLTHRVRIGAREADVAILFAVIVLRDGDRHVVESDLDNRLEVTRIATRANRLFVLLKRHDADAASADVGESLSIIENDDGDEVLAVVLAHVHSFVVVRERKAGVSCTVSEDAGLASSVIEVEDRLVASVLEVALDVGEVAADVVERIADLVQSVDERVCGDLTLRVAIGDLVESGRSSVQAVVRLGDLAAVDGAASDKTIRNAADSGDGVGGASGGSTIGASSHRYSLPQIGGKCNGNTRFFRKSCCYKDLQLVDKCGQRLIGRYSVNLAHTQQHIAGSRAGSRSAVLPANGATTVLLLSDQAMIGDGVPSAYLP